MATMELKGDRACAMSPEDFTPEHIAVAVLMRRFTEIGKDALRDIVSLVEQWMAPETPAEDHMEIFETIREILFPELVGDICFLPAGSEQEMPKILRRRAEHVGKMLKRIRNAKNIKQVALAKKAGLPQSHISRLETGTHSPSFKTLTKIAKALEVEVGDLDPTH